MDEYIKAVELLKKYKQNHVLSLLEKTRSVDLINEVLSIDFDKIMKLYEDTKIEEVKQEKNIEPIEYIVKANIKEKDELADIGDNIISQGKYAIVTMAGGQGTRLGFDGPKGKYLIDVLPKPKYLFEIICDKLEKANNRYNTTIFWYVMVSKENSKETIDFFEEQEYFGYSKDYVIFFEQSEMPLIDKQGKMLIDENNRIKQASDGNGQIFKSMEEKGVLKHLKEHNIEWILIHSIDNILIDVTDNLFLGLIVNQNNLLGGKSVIKKYADERVGVYCKVNSKIGIIEYTEISKELAELTDKNNEFIYGQSNIACNLFHISLLELLSKQQLPYHKALKANSYVDENGILMKPIEPNAYKFESFIFDALKNCDKITLLQCKREEEFAPVKNATGVDSPETAIKLYNDFFGKE